MNSSAALQCTLLVLLVKVGMLTCFFRCFSSDVLVHVLLVVFVVFPCGGRLEDGSALDLVAVLAGGELLVVGLVLAGDEGIGDPGKKKKTAENYTHCTQRHCAQALKVKFSRARRSNWCCCCVCERQRDKGGPFAFCSCGL